MDADVTKRATQKKALENIKNGLATKVRIIATRRRATPAALIS